MTDHLVGKIRDDWEKAQKAHNEGYVWGWQWGHDDILAQVGKLVGRYVQGKVLEIGCGGGKWTQWLFQFTDEVHSMDVHKTAIEEAARHEPRAHYKLCDGETLKWPAYSFDTVFTWDVLLHLPDLLVQRYFAEAHRVLKVGGRIIFALPDLMTECGKAMYCDAVKARRYRHPYSYGYMTYYTEQRVREMLRIAGLVPCSYLGHAGAPEPREMVFIARKWEDE